MTGTLSQEHAWSFSDTVRLVEEGGQRAVWGPVMGCLVNQQKDFDFE